MPEIVLPGNMAHSLAGSHWPARLQQVTYEVGLSGARGALLAFADFDSDNYVDLFLAAAEEDTGKGAHRHGPRPGALPDGHAGQERAQRWLQTWTWRGDAHSGRFQLAKQWLVPGLVGLIPGDFDGNGQLDAVAVTTHERCGRSGALSVLLCNHSFECSTPLSVMMSQPLALDLDGDMRTDLLASYTELDARTQRGHRHCESQLHEACTLADAPLISLATSPSSSSAATSFASRRFGCCDCGLVCVAAAGWHSDADDGICMHGPLEARAWLNEWSGPSGFRPLQPFDLAPNLNVTRPFTPWPSAPTPLRGMSLMPTASIWPWEEHAPDSHPLDAPPAEQSSSVQTAVPNSNANVDLDGDCRADLVIVALPGNADGRALGCENVACRLLIWLQKTPPVAAGRGATTDTNTNASAVGAGLAGSSASVAGDRGPDRAAESASDYSALGERWPRLPSLNLTLPVGASQLSFADLDADGLIDIVFMAPGHSLPGGTQRNDASGSRAVIHIWYSQLVRRTSTTSPIPKATCEPPSRGIDRAGQLCVVQSDEVLTFYRRAFSLPTGWIIGEGGAAAAFPADLQARPTTLSIADFFLDGYPDVLLPLRAPYDWEMGRDGQSRFSGRGCEADERCLALLHNDVHLRCEEASELAAYSSLPASSTDAISDSNGARLYPLLSRASTGVRCRRHLKLPKHCVCSCIALTCVHLAGVLRPLRGWCMGPACGIS